MNFLIIYSHPYDKSFNRAICDNLVDELKRQGQPVRERDLYALKFDPVLKAEELAGFQRKVYPPDVRQEQQEIMWADLLIFISPIWWGGMTAIARGYCDRVFSLNFAYAETEQGPKGLLSAKKSYFINTFGAPFEVYKKMGMLESMSQTMGKVICDFCGIKLIGQKFFGSVGSCPPEERQAILKEVRKIAVDLTSG